MAIVISDSLLKGAFSENKVYSILNDNGLRWLRGFAQSGLQLSQAATLLKTKISVEELAGATVIICCGSNDAYPRHDVPPDVEVASKLAHGVKDVIMRRGARQVLFLGVPKRRDRTHSVGKEAARDNLNLTFKTICEAQHPKGWLDLGEGMKSADLRDGIHPTLEAQNRWKAAIFQLARLVLLEPRPPSPPRQPLSLEMLFHPMDETAKRVCRLVPGAGTHQSGWGSSRYVYFGNAI